ncbi:hypothetical protein L1987_71107 [Smallanthus sonchifolius]|uniref:Uncharacterized protein n=1 Tax=Smallanthus sonchifolius TaxID=185202 RepID=A0ACB9AR62_9ASTR|nr:hypothetical protein L1987_71107 [Smallanthus sonchifolius]
MTLPAFKSSVTALSWTGSHRQNEDGILAIGMETGLIELWVKGMGDDRRGAEKQRNQQGGDAGFGFKDQVENEGHSHETLRKKVDESNRAQVHQGHRVAGNPRREHGKSFRDALLYNSAPDGSRSVTEGESSSKTIIVPEDIEAFKSFYLRSLVGRLVDFKALTNIHKSLIEIGCEGSSPLPVPATGEMRMEDNEQLEDGEFIGSDSRDVHHREASNGTECSSGPTGDFSKYTIREEGTNVVPQ